MSALKQGVSEFSDRAAGIGADIRALRKSRNLTLKELALKIGRSVGFVSQVERGVSAPSIEDLRSIADALEAPLGLFFVGEGQDAPESKFIVRAKSRRVLGTKETGLFEELLSPDLGGSFEMFRTVIEPGAKTQNDILRDTEESGFLVSGSLELWIDGEHFHLIAGDSFRFDHKPFRWENAGAEPAVIVWVVSPPTY